VKPTLLFFFLCLWFYPYAVNAQRRPGLDKNRKREVAEVLFEGNANISALELKSIIETHHSNGLEHTLNRINSDWGDPQQFIDESTLDDDTVRVFVYYRDKGYFDAHVKYSLHESKESVAEWEKVSKENNMLPPERRQPYPVIEDTVIFRVKEGKPYKVSGFTFEGFEGLPMDLQAKLTDNIGIKLNSQYSRTSLDLEIIRAKQILAESGYPFLSLPPGSIDAELDTLHFTVTISLKFKTGPRVRVGASKIVYDTAYTKFGTVDEDVIMRQVHLDSGTWYSNSSQVASERNLGRLGTFQYQSISLDTTAFNGVPDSLRNGMVLPVIINLRMRKTSDASIYPSFGVNTFSQFIFGGGLSYTNRNILNVADNFTGQVSYQLLPLNQRVGSIGGNFIFPYIGIQNVPLILSGNYTYSDQKSDSTHRLQFLERNYNGTIALNFQLFNSASLIALLIPKVSVQTVDLDYRDSSIFGGHIDTTLKAQKNVIISSDVSFNWTNDARNPSSGTYFLLSPQIALPVANNSAIYLKSTVQIKEFFDIATTPERSILGFNLVAGYIALRYPDNPAHDILLENRYYGGGTSSLRGWAARSLLVSNNPTQGLPQFGGYKTFVVSLEWRYGLFNAQSDFAPLHLGTFLDAGNVWDKDVPIALRNFSLTAGTGLRINTLIGAVRLDLGFKLYDPYPYGTVGRSGDNVLAIPPNATSGAWLWNRKARLIYPGDFMTLQFGIGQAF
jgi:outer membrane protein assembly factor BamA